MSSLPDSFGSCYWPDAAGNKPSAYRWNKKEALFVPKIKNTKFDKDSENFKGITAKEEELLMKEFEKIQKKSVEGAEQELDNAVQQAKEEAEKAELVTQASTIGGVYLWQAGGMSVDAVKSKFKKKPDEATVESSEETKKKKKGKKTKKKKKKGNASTQNSSEVPKKNKSWFKKTKQKTNIITKKCTHKLGMHKAKKWVNNYNWFYKTEQSYNTMIKAAETGSSYTRKSIIKGTEKTYQFIGKDSAKAAKIATSAIKVGPNATKFV